MVAFTTRGLAQAAGISEQAVRDYEASGLLPPVPRRANGYRAYSAMHLAGLLVVRALKAAGYTRAEMTAVMDAVRQGALPAALELLDSHHAALRERRASLSRVAMDGIDIGSPDCGPSSATRDETVSLGEAAKRLGVRPSTVRFWESLGLFSVGRNPANGYRQFGPRDLACIAEIARLRSLGVPWDAIRDAAQPVPRAWDADRQDSRSGIVGEIDRQSGLNARATAMVCAYAAAFRHEETDADVAFRTAIAAMRDPESDEQG
jgi:DNA-binding transcriptional MerR regulator